ncbi:MAG: hypothetical protein IPJ69_07375 [Deltaproteobacteria bacterium]|nr:MAG: hypothetical protein IPJ69_07375 [Deltaproteobacteria bacterium]
MQETVTLPTNDIEFEKRDTFRKATILKYFPQSNYGFVKDEHNTEIYFHVDEMRFVGDRRDKSLLVEGRKVGIDIGRTSRGMRVTFMKIY